MSPEIHPEKPRESFLSDSGEQHKLTHFSSSLFRKPQISFPRVAEEKGCHNPISEAMEDISDSDTPALSVAAAKLLEPDSLETAEPNVERTAAV